MSSFVQNKPDQVQSLQKKKEKKITSSQKLTPRWSNHVNTRGALQAFILCKQNLGHCES